MSRRYAAVFIRNGQGDNYADHLVEVLANRTKLHPVLRRGRLRLLADEGFPHTLAEDNNAIILGNVFPSTSIPSTRLMSRQNGQKPAATICHQAWGEYILLALAPETGELDILRDPSGAISAYTWTSDAITVVMSDASIALDLNLTKGIFDWQAVASSLAYTGLRSENTGLMGISEILPGTCLTVSSDHVTKSTAWSPCSFVSSAESYDSYDKASIAIRHAVSDVSMKLASVYPRILLELSGGLDSSIVAASLCNTGAEVLCENVSTWDGGADEVDYARAVAANLGYPFQHHEIDYAFAVMPAHRPSFRPGMDTLQQIVDQVFQTQALSHGVDAFFTGAGGDNVFCYLKNAAPAADALAATKPIVFWNALKDLAHMHQCSVWKVLKLARRKLFSRPAGIWKTDRTFLTGLYVPPHAPSHPWLSADAKIYPGRHEHINSLIWTQNYRDAMARAIIAPVVLPLLAQPVMETCLRVPTWMWVREGRNRACARTAFEDSLPFEVSNRRSKGNFLGIYTHAYEQNRDRLIDTLTGGRLARAGILDARAVKAALLNPLVARDHGFLRLMDMAKTEAWMEGWSGFRGDA